MTEKEFEEAIIRIRLKQLRETECSAINHLMELNHKLGIEISVGDFVKLLNQLSSGEISWEEYYSNLGLEGSSPPPTRLELDRHN